MLLMSSLEFKRAKIFIATFRAKKEIHPVSMGIIENTRVIIVSIKHTIWMVH